ncbi:MAG: hypothetical protein EBZ95_13290 [Chitinophagia bacterium]|nr:hypothetical protein [Chitinophagia bacterium]
MRKEVDMLEMIENCHKDNFIVNQFISPGYFLGKVDVEVLNIIKTEIDSIQKKSDDKIKWNNNLAGQIKKEFYLSESIIKVEGYFVQIAKQFYEYNYYGRPMGEMKLIDLWVNFQQKNEYNPPHNHQGVVSFVIWINIPYLIEDEIKLINSDQTTNPCAAKFAFIYTTADGTITSENLPVDKRYEGVICIFPSTVNHMVYPFKSSDGYRISVSGNIGFKANYTS